MRPSSALSFQDVSAGRLHAAYRAHVGRTEGEECMQGSIPSNRARLHAQAPLHVRGSGMHEPPTVLNCVPPTHCLQLLAFQQIFGPKYKDYATIIIR